jgi:hypothetical protein
MAPVFSKPPGLVGLCAPRGAGWCCLLVVVVSGCQKALGLCYRLFCRFVLWLSFFRLT